MLQPFCEFIVKLEIAPFIVVVVEVVVDDDDGGDATTAAALVVYDFVVLLS